MKEKQEVIEARAKLSHARISARKVKIVIDLIRGKDVNENIEWLESEVQSNDR